MRQSTGEDLLDANDPRGKSIGIIYVSPTDDRASVLAGILTQEKLGRKQVAVVLPENNRAFSRATDFDRLKNMRRSLMTEIVFVAPASSGPAEFARQRRFQVYTSLENYASALREAPKQEARRGWFTGLKKGDPSTDNAEVMQPLPLVPPGPKHGEIPPAALPQAQIREQVGKVDLFTQQQKDDFTNNAFQVKQPLPKPLPNSPLKAIAPKTADDQVQRDLNVGRQIGNYRLIALIRSGSFGSVYQGQHIIFEDAPIVAIKLLNAPLYSQQDREVFIKEAQILRKLQHPHILHIQDAGFQDGIPYLVTEYAAGGSLRERISKANSKPFPLEEAIQILTQVGQALDYAHDQQIVHRDLKPENILFNAKGEALLADFGLAVILASKHTHVAGIGGTYPYMAPEQFEGLASPKSDQYALGCIAYELVTGHLLFEIPLPTLETYWFNHTKVEPARPTYYNQQLPAHIELSIVTALAKNRENRHQNVLTFCDSLLKDKDKWLDEADALYKLERFQEALAAYEQAILLDPNDANAYNGKGNALRELKRSREALIAFEQAILLDPGNSTFRLNKEALLNSRASGSRVSRASGALGEQPNSHASNAPKKELMIYLSPQEGLNEVRERIELAPARDILLVVPSDTQLRSHVGWRLLHARASELGKVVRILCTSNQVRAVAKAAGFLVLKAY